MPGYAITLQLCFVAGQGGHSSEELCHFLLLSGECPKGQGNVSAQNFSCQQDCKEEHYFCCCSNGTRKVETSSLVLQVSFLKNKKYNKVIKYRECKY